jgi:hypothetical protein
MARAGAGVNGLFHVGTENAPLPKWFRVFDKRGKPAGLGFQCPKCHLGYPHDAPEKIFHCGAEEKQPRITALLPARRIGGDPALPPRVIPIGTW